MSRKWRGGASCRRPPNSAAPAAATGATALTARGSRGGPFPRNLVEDAEPLCDVSFADDERRQEAQHVLAGGQREEPIGPERRDEIACCQALLAADAEEKARAAQPGGEFG